LEAEKEGVLRKEDARKQYDGSLFYEIEERRKRKRGEGLPW
jgi:Caleosin related protein